MNKKFLLFGLVAMVGFVTLTAFGGKTKEQQLKEIQDAVTAKLETYRSELTAACDARVATEAEKRFQEVLAARAAEAGLKPAAAKSGGKKVTAPKGPTAPVKPTAPTNTGTSRPGATQRDVTPTPVERPGATNKSTAPAPVARPGAKQREGGN